MGIANKSSHLIEIPISDNKYFVFHSLYGKPVIIDHNSLSFINKINSINIDRSSSICKYEELLNTYFNLSFIIKENEDERIKLIKDNENYLSTLKSKNYFASIGFSTGSSCNFDCSYCMSTRLANTSCQQNRFLDKFDYRIAKDIIDSYFSLLKDNNIRAANIGFSGGEPMIHWTQLMKTINYIQNKYGYSYDLDLRINTNASLINEDAAYFIKKHNIKPSVSLDGYNKELNDKVRFYSNSSLSSFNSIISGINKARSFGIRIDGFYLTLTSGNINISPKKLISFLHNNKFNNITVEPDLLGLDTPIDILIEKLLSIEMACRETGIKINGFWRRPYSRLISSHNNCNLAFCEALKGEIIAVDNNGKYHICPYSDSKFQHNDITKIRNSDEYHSLITDNLVGNIDECINCEIEGMCIGGCYITREYSKRKSDPSIFSSRCELYKKITFELIKLHWSSNHSY